jgi:glycosyltransferase involved in cell wall biosynthesis
VRVLQQSNRGVSHARNRAIEQARGDWVALLDSDDRWYPDKLAHQSKALINNPGARWCHCDEHWLRNGKRVNPRHKHRKYGGDVFARCLPLCCISPSAVMIHRTVFDDRGMFDESLPACEDYDLWLRISAHESIVYVDKPLLEKTGGHADQLSQRYPAMDRFRLQSLARLLRSHTLSDAQQALALSTLQDKLTIVCIGAQKRGRHEEADTLRRQYRDLLVSAHIL